MNNNNTVNAPSVAPQVIRYSSTDTVTVNGTDYTITETYTGGKSPVYATRIEFIENGVTATLTIPAVFAVAPGYPVDTVYTPAGIPAYELAGIIAGAIAYADASHREWERTH
jgi:hypothetical protein